MHCLRWNASTSWLLYVPSSSFILSYFHSFSSDVQSKVSTEDRQRERIYVHHLSCTSAHQTWLAYVRTYVCLMHSVPMFNWQRVCFTEDHWKLKRRPLLVFPVDRKGADHGWKWNRLASCRTSALSAKSESNRWLEWVCCPYCAH